LGKVGNLAASSRYRPGTGMKIVVIGTGYVGLVSGTCFAEEGNTVICVDIDEDKVSRMQNGQMPIYEPGLEVLFHRNIQEQRLSFTTNLKAGIQGAEIIFLALPTPPGSDGSADLSYVLGMAEELGPMLEEYVVIVDKSTVPVGTAEKVRAKIAASSKVDFDVVSNPEFLREGFAVADFMRPDRIVVGSSSERADKLMERLYLPFVRTGNPILFMSERSAEMTKYAANAILATRLSFMNEIANMCEYVGADVDSVRLGVGHDPRIGKRFLFPGIGYGGSCFPKDVAALKYMGGQEGYHFRVLEAVEQVNEYQKTRLFEKITRHYKGDLRDRVFALWGLSFKPDTDDIREAPSLAIIEQLTSAGAKVVGYDPVAIPNVKRQRGDNPNLSFSSNPYDALGGADALLIATEWGEFKTPDFRKIKQYLKKPVIFDGRNVFSLDEMKEQGFKYYSIGRPVV